MITGRIKAMLEACEAGDPSFPPNVLFNEIARRYGADTSGWWPRIGRPIGRALWTQTLIGAEGLKWVLTQPFERGILTYHPHYVNRPEFVIQGALVGNLLLRPVSYTHLTLPTICSV